MKPLFYLLSILLVLSMQVQADVPRTMYIMNGSGETVSKMIMDSKAITQNIAPTGQMPNQIVAHHTMVYILDSGTSDIKILDPRSDRIIKTIPLQPGANPYDIEFVGVNKAYVTNWVNNTVSVVDLDQGSILKDIDVGKAPQDIMVLNNQAFVTNTGYAGYGSPYEQGTVNIIDILTDTVIDTIKVPTNPQKTCVSPDGNIHVLCTGDYGEQVGRVAVINLYSGPMYNIPAVVDTIELGGAPGDLEITPSGKGYAIAWGDDTNGFLYSYDVFSGTVSHNADNPVKVGPNTGHLLYDGKEDCLWIPYMTFFGGDGFVQKYDIATDSVVWISDVLGNGSQKIAILEPIWDITPWADAVASFTPGSGAGFGENYFPDNVLGPPDQSPGLNEYTASSKPQEVLSLGHGGEIILEFKDNTIVDGDGVDFTVFENPFISFVDNKPFVEAGIVSVSQDGETFVEFPYDTATWEGLAGVTPMKNNYEFTDPGVSGGDLFDLATVGLEWASYVKITDLGDIKQEGDWNGDFDLDAVVAVNYTSTAVRRENQTVSSPMDFHLSQNYPNPFNPSTTIEFTLSKPGDISLDVYNIFGQRVRTLKKGPVSAGRLQVTWDGRDQSGRLVPSAPYIAQLKTDEGVKRIRMILLR